MITTPVFLAHLTNSPHLHSGDALAAIVAVLVGATAWFVFLRVC